MTTDMLSRDVLNWIIGTYDLMCTTNEPDVPTLLLDGWGFTEDEVRRAIGLGPDQDFMRGLSSYLENEFGICDLT